VRPFSEMFWHPLNSENHLFIFHIFPATIQQINISGIFSTDSWHGIHMNSQAYFWNLYDHIQVDGILSTYTGIRSEYRKNDGYFSIFPFSERVFITFGFFLVYIGMPVHRYRPVLIQMILIPQYQYWVFELNTFNSTRCIQILFDTRPWTWLTDINIHINVKIIPIFYE